MAFSYSKENLPLKEKWLQRLLEILPGLTSWGILAGLGVLSITMPVAASIITIAFIFFWFLRLIYMTIFLVLSYLRLSVEKKTAWLKRIGDVDAIIQGHIPPSPPGVYGWGRQLSERAHRQQIFALTESRELPPSSQSIHHLVIIPVAKESRDIIEPGVQALSAQTFPARRILLVLALEERAPEETKNAVEAIAQKYQKHFLEALIVIHPSGLPGEARVKGANTTFAAKFAKERLIAKSIPVEHVIVSCFDADTVVDENYMASLTYYFLVTPDRWRVSFQPIPVFHNNIWDVPPFSRVMETGSSFFQLIEATNPDKLVTFSSHSMSFKALVDVDYWPVDMISDDSAIFWKCFLHYDGRYRVMPMFITLSMDATQADTWRTTAKNIYKQKRRWAWGVENFPLVIRGFMANPRIPLHQKVRHGFKLFEGHITWATWGILLTTLGWLPAILAGQSLEDSVIFYTEPQILSTMFSLSSLSLLISIILSTTLLPPKTFRFGWLRKTLHALEWLAVPLVLVFLSTLPALDAQTRLMLGRYMEFWVTDKARSPRNAKQPDTL